MLTSKHREDKESVQKQHRAELNAERTKCRETNTLLSEQKQKFEEIIAAKDEQIEKLKIQMAESFDVNSRERQKQIDELVKELKLVTDECAYLKNIIQQHANFAKCQKCSFYEKKCKDLSEEMITQTEHCKQLMAVCSKKELQLTQQDELCAVLAGLKTEINKK